MSMGPNDSQIFNDSVLENLNQNNGNFSDEEEDCDDNPELLMQLEGL